MMRIIVYQRDDGGVSYVRPAPGARLARRIVLRDGRTLDSETPRPADTFVRAWPVEGTSVEWAESEDEFLARIIAKDVPPTATQVRIIDAAELPADREFRDAWVLRETGIAHDMAKCREIWRQKLRAERAPRLAALDVEYMRADERGDALEKARISALKQALRDAPADPRIDAAQTPEELKQVTLPA